MSPIDYIIFPFAILSFLFICWILELIIYFSSNSNHCNRILGSNNNNCKSFNPCILITLFINFTPSEESKQIKQINKIIKRKIIDLNKMMLICSLPCTLAAMYLQERYGLRFMARLFCLYFRYFLSISFYLLFIRCG